MVPLHVRECTKKKKELYQMPTVGFSKFCFRIPWYIVKTQFTQG